jgi:hypothetical protein
MMSDLNTEKARGISFVFGMLVCGYLFVSSDYSFSQIVSFTLILILSITLLSPDNWKLFLSFFLVSVIISRLLIADFMRQNGTPYIGGGDDKLFNDVAVYFARNEIDFEDVYYLAMPYKLYLFVLSNWIKTVAFISNETINHSYQTSLLMLNSFTGALVTVNIKKLLTYVGIYKKLSSLGVILVFFNPFLLYYSSVLLREITVVYFISTFFVTLFSAQRIDYKIAISLVCFIATFLIRPANAILIPITLGVVYFKNLKNTFSKAIFLVAIMLVSFVVILPNINSILGKNVDSTSEMYKELALEQASGSSIGVKLIQSTNPVVKIILPIYTLFSPIPPPILTDYSFRSFIISLGSISWSVILVILIPNLIKFLNSKSKTMKKENWIYFDYVLVLVPVCIIHTILVGLGSSDPRHLLLLYPTIIPIALTEFKPSDIIQYSLYYTFIFFFIFAGVLSYLLLKLI